MVIQTGNVLQVREQQAKDTQADGDIMAALGQQVKIVHNLPRQFMVAVVVVVPAKKVFHGGVGMQMPKAVTA
jgi:hypothetical protein